MAEPTFKKPLRVVVVDDDPEMVKAIEVMLRIAGIDVKGAFSGVTGYMLAKRELPDAIVLDIMMPDIDGYEVCRKLKLNPDTKHIPVIFVTARTGQEHIERGLSLGAQGYITKPFEPSELIEKLSEVTGSS
ncbi:MAG TPA: response regulator [Candidatus Anoxymicrobiaceae bacterium]